MNCGAPNHVIQYRHTAATAKMPRPMTMLISRGRFMIGFSPAGSRRSPQPPPNCKRLHYYAPHPRQVGGHGGWAGFVRGVERDHVNAVSLSNQVVEVVGNVKRLEPR